MNKRGFIKIASVETIAIATSDGNSFIRTAAYQEENKSEFLSNHKTIDLAEKLAMLADEYDISPNPGDYIFEAIRGNTSNVPNENKDGFHKHELLRFDHRLGKQVYRTYENKPHHINHRADNPKNARGFIVDAHYNDSTPSLDECPNPECKNKTASEDGRDPETGIHCRKCGEVVKDEFVELLIAIDTQKDPAFANGVKNGILKNGSMGCSCVRTRCNVCGNVAYTRSEFCNHIARKQNKGKEYDDSEPDFNPIAFIISYDSKGKTAPRRIAKAFEWCEGVVFDEYSRVHDPADIKAEQYEILQLSAKVAQLQKDDQLRNESEILVLQAKVKQLEQSIEEKFADLQKTAQVAPPPPITPDEEPVTPALPAPSVPETEEPGVTVNINVGEGEGVEIESGEPLEEAPVLGTPIEELTPEAMGLTPAGPGQQLTPEAMGVAPPPKRGSNRETVKNSGGLSMLRFAGSYKHLQAEITEANNIRVFDKEGTLFVVKPEKVPNDSKVAGKEKQELAKNVLTMIAEHGIGGTIRRTNAIVGPRLAQVLEYYMDDMLNEDRVQTNSVVDEADQDTQDKRPANPETATGAGEESDAQDKHETKDYKGVDVLEGRDTDVEDEQHDRDPNSMSVTEMHDTDQRDEREEFNMNKSTLDDVTLDHTERQAAKGEFPENLKDKKKDKDDKKDKKAGTTTNAVDARKHAARLEALFNKRLEAKVAELEREKQQFINTFTDRFVRAMKIVARRQSLNLEHSPLKEAMTEALLNPRPLGGGYEYEPMDDALAVNLVEASINEPLVEGIDKPAWEAHIDGLIERTGEIMKMSDESLMQIEADLKNMTVVAPPTQQVMSTHTASRENDELRQRAAAGNLQLTSNNSEPSVHESPRGNKREAIRQAVGTTKVASSRSSLGV